MPERFDDLPILEELGDALGAAFREHDGRAAPAGRRPVAWPSPFAGGRLRRTLVILALALGVGATAAAAALLALRATVIPAPPLRDVPPAMRALPGSAQVSELLAPDPDGRPSWTIRTTRSQTGLTCSTVGQVVQGEFGIVGLDGRFRLLPERTVDACGTPVADRAALLGVRIFDADRQALVRTVLSGVGGPALRTAQLRTVSGVRTVPVDERGRFLAVMRGYPEDSAPLIVLRFADGRVQRRQFGRLEKVARDPAGGPAMTTDLVRFEAGPKMCIRVMGLRGGREAPLGPHACALRTADAMLMVSRRLHTGETGDDLFLWRWGNAPTRTVVWGWLRRPARLTLLGAGPPRNLPLQDDGSYVLLLPARVDPRRLRLRVRPLDGGAPRLLAPGAGLTRPPKLAGSGG